MMTARGSLLVVAAMLLAACGDDAPTAFAVRAVVPPHATEGHLAAVRIEGGFPAALHVSFEDRDDSKLSSRYSARLGGHALADVRWLGAAVLAATVPADLPVGTYPLVVKDPGGREVTLERAFTVKPRTTAVVSIEDAPGGGGEVVGDGRLVVGDALEVFAIGRAEDGVFVEDLAVQWAVEGGVGRPDPDSGPRTTLVVEAPGSGRVIALHPEHGAASTGTFLVLECARDEQCDDADACNGVETCLEGMCLAGSAPECDDANVCTDDRCEASAGCVHDFNTAPCDDADTCSARDRCDGEGRCAAGLSDRDGDRDGTPDALCPGGLDCDDADPDVWASCGTCADADGDGLHAGCDAHVQRPGPDCADAIPTCTTDCSTDTDRDGVPDCADRCLDGDRDGRGAPGGAGDECVGRDCEDADPDVWDACGSCRDADEDGLFTACDDYLQRAGPDCDDAVPTCAQSCAGDEDDDGISDCADACVDHDGDGRGLPGVAGSGCLAADCDDTDPGNWGACDTCVDEDGDTWFVGCDDYPNRSGPDCYDRHAACRAGCENRTPARLEARLRVSPAVASTGQAITLTMDVENLGESGAVAFTPRAPLLAGTAGVSLVAGPVAADVAGSASGSFVWTYRAQGAGAGTFEAGGAATDANCGQDVAAAPAASPSFTIRTAAQLTAEALVDRTRVSVGQPFTLTLRVRNEGEAAALAVTPSIAGSTGPGGAASTAVPEAADVPGGQSRDFVFRYEAATAGDLSFVLAAAGRDENSAEPARVAGVAAPAIRIVTPPALRGALAADRVAVTVGQRFGLTLTVTNDGEAAAIGVSPDVTPFAGTGAVSVVTAPASQDVPGGEARTFRFVLEATEAGPLELASDAHGTDENRGTRVDMARVKSPALLVQSRPAVWARLRTSPTRVDVGQTGELEMEVHNDGGAGLLAFASDAPVPQGDAAMTLGAAPAQQDVPGGSMRVFRWTWRADGPGLVDFAAGGRGTDANSGLEVRADVAYSNRITVQSPPSLTGVAVVSPARASVGQEVTLELRVTNAGGGDANAVAATAALATGSTATLTAVASPPAGVVAGGSTRTYTWKWLTTGAGTVAFTLDAAGVSANSALAVAMPRVTTGALTVDTPARLTAAARVAPAQASIGQTFTFKVDVTNSGEAAALGVAAALPVLLGDGTASVVTSPAAQDVPGGATRSFVWTCRATGSGSLTIAASLEGADANTGAKVSVGANAGPVRLQTAAALTAVATLSPARASTGQTVTLALVVTNGGEAAARTVTPTTPVKSGEGSATLAAAPDPQDIPGGSSRTFTWTYTATGAGDVGFAVDAAGTDENSGLAVATASAASNAVLVQTRASLAGTLAVSPARVSVGQLVTLTLSVTNAGEATATGVAPGAPVRAGAGGVTLESSPDAADVAGGATRTFVWTYLAAGPGEVTFTVGAAGEDANSRAVVTMADATAGTLTIDTPATLAATARATPAQASLGQTLTFTVDVTNSGEAAALGVTPAAPVLTGPGTASVLSSPEAQDVPAGATRSFVWTFRATGSGALSFAATLEGADANSGEAVRVSASAGPITLQKAAAISAVATLSPARASTGQTVTLSLVVTNAGEATARAVTPGDPVASGTGSLAPATAPEPQDVPGGSSRTFTWTWTADGAGEVAFTVAAAGTDDNSGLAVSTGDAASGSVLVQRRASLTGSLAISLTRASVGQSVTLTLGVTNEGEATATGVAPGTLTRVGAGSVAVVSAPASADVAGGATRTFAWTLRAETPGAVTFSVGAAAVDANSSAAVTLAPVTAGSLAIDTPAALTATARATPAQASLGQTLTFTVEVTNSGQAAALGVTAAEPVLTGPGAASVLSSPAAQDVPGGATRSFVWSYRAMGSGALTFAATLAGADANSGNAVSVGAGAPPISLQKAAAISAAATLSPARASTGQTVTLELVVTNAGEATARAVTPGAPAKTGTGSLTLATAPGAQDVPGGSSRTFTWVYTAGGSGDVALSVAASGADENSGLAVSTGNAASNTIRVQQRAAIAGTLAMSPARASVGQAVTLTLTVTNSGEATATGVAPGTPMRAGAGTVTPVSAPTAQDVPGGATRSFVWTWRAAGSGAVTFTVGAAGVDANSGAAVAMADASAGPLTIETAGLLTATARATPAQASVGQTLTLTLDVTNAGEAAALGVATSALVLTGPGTASLVTSPAAQDVPGGSTRSFVWTYRATGSGAISFAVTLEGADANTGDAVSVSASAGPLLLQKAAALTGVATISPARASTGQTVTFALVVTNAGEATARTVTPGTPAKSGEGSLTLATAPTAQEIPGGATRTFTWTYTAAGSGSVALTVAAEGTDANSGVAVSTGPTTSSEVLVQTRASITGTLAVSPARASVGQAVTLTLRVTNEGEATATGVAPGTPTRVGAGTVTPVSAPTTEDVAGGATRSFVWTYRAQGAGPVTFTVGAAGVDANSGGAVTLVPLSSGALAIETPAQLTATARAAPAQASVGQTITFTVDVTNSGQAAALGVTPAAPVLSGPGTVSVLSSPVAQDLSGGATRSFVWTFRATGPGALGFAATLAGADANSSSAVSASASAGPILLQSAAALSADATISPARASTGQTVTLSLVVTNDGEAVARGVTPGTPTKSGAGSVTLVSAPTAQDVPGGASRTFSWTYTATGAGAVSFTIAAAGTDANSGLAVSTGNAVSNSMLVQQRAAITGVLAVSPARASAGQAVTLTLNVTNTGEATATGVAPGTPTRVGAGGVTLVSAPAAADVAGGATRAFAWTWRADGSGEVTFSVGAAGVDANSGVVVSMLDATSGALTVQTPANLSATARAAPAQASLGQTLTFTVEVTNSGEAAAPGVTAGAPVLTGPGTASVLSTPAAQAVPGGATRSFVWTYRATGSGALTFAATLDGADANSGDVVSASAIAAPILLQRAAAMSAVATLSPSSASTGQTVTLALAVTNAGEATARTVTPGTPTRSGAGSLTLVSAPNAQDIPGGSTRTFAWTYTAASPGGVTLTVAAAGTDENSGLTITTGDAASNSALVQTRASLAGTLVVSPARASAGQAVTLTLSVTNAGEATATGVAPGTPTRTGAGSVTPVSAPSAADVPGGSTRSFVWTWTAAGPGEVTFSVGAAGVDANSGAVVAMLDATSGALTVQTPAALTSTLETTPALMNEGATITLRLRVRNTGEASATGVAPTAVTIAGSTSATLVSGPTPASAAIAGGAEQAFVWSYTAGARGTLGFTSGAQGTDANSGATVSAAASSGPTVTVQRAAVLTAGWAAPPARINVGQRVTLELTVANGGDSGAAAVTPSAPAVTGTGAVTLVSGPTPATATIAGGSSQTFRWTYEGAAPGSVAMTADAAGTDAVGGQTVTAASKTTPSIVVERAAALSATLSVPSVIHRGGSFIARLRVLNTGAATAAGVAPAAPVVTGTGSVVLRGSTTTPVTLAGGAQTDFTWTYEATAAGSLQLASSASGVDANSGATVSASATASATIVEVQLLASDPFGDGTAFAFVFARDGKVHLGPNKTGSTAIRAQPDFSSPETLTFGLHRDKYGGNESKNTSITDVFPSIGATGCTTDTLGCGPDNENGRGIFLSGTLAGSEWLLLAGGRSAGDLDYVYLSDGATNPLDFPFVDLSVLLGGATRGMSAGRFFNDRAYLGFTDTGGSRPYFIELITKPANGSPGYNAVSSVDAVNLQGAEMPPFKDQPIIDTITDFNGLLYAFNAGGCMRAGVTSPRNYKDFPGDWAVCGSGTVFPKTAVTTTKMADIVPSDKAFPQAAAYRGRLYVARNTTSGPQLWACSPVLTGATNGCDPGDWSVVAADTSDPALTRFDNPRNTHINMLVATSRYLYVGYANATDGVVVFRTAATSPSAQTDFEGLGGCSAAADPPGCPGLGGNGFGLPAANTSIASAEALLFGAEESVYVVAGSATAPLRLYRIAP